MRDWIAIDWGTTHLRAWDMAGTQVKDTRRCDQGMARLDRDGYEAALLDLVGDWLTDPRLVLACGMVGSRQGWAEAPYRSVPCAALDPEALTQVAAADPRLDVRLVAGVKQTGPADVMRGEETQIAGYLAAHPKFDGVLCLPGTHTKWVHISAQEIVSFRTFMTGEMFELLSSRSVLRHIGGDGWDDAAFAEAVGDAMSNPAMVAQRLFGIRAEMLLADLSPAAARARLSGLLVGLELAGSRAYWLGQNVAIVGADQIAGVYASALKTLGVSPSRMSGDAATLAGLASIHAALSKDVT